MAHQFHEFGNMPPLGAENIVDKVYQLFVLTPPLRVTEAKHFVRRTTLSYTRHSQIGQTTLHTIQQSDAEPLEICTGRLCDHLTPIAVTYYLCVKNAHLLRKTTLYSPSTTAPVRPQMRID